MEGEKKRSKRKGRERDGDGMRVSVLFAEVTRCCESEYACV